METHISPPPSRSVVEQILWWPCRRALLRHQLGIYDHITSHAQVVPRHDVVLGIPWIITVEVCRQGIDVAVDEAFSDRGCVPIVLLENTLRGQYIFGMPGWELSVSLAPLRAPYFDRSLFAVSSVAFRELLIRIDYVGCHSWSDYRDVAFWVARTWSNAMSRFLLLFQGDGICVSSNLIVSDVRVDLGHCISYKLHKWEFYLPRLRIG